MPFKNYKASHNGTGPFGSAYEALTDGVGIFGRRGLAEERRMTNSLIDSIQGREELAGLGAVAEAGRAPMTREQHAEFRSALLQEALNTEMLDSHYAAFTVRMGKLRETAGELDLPQLDVLEDQAAYAHDALRSGVPEMRTMGASAMARVMTDMHAYTVAQEDQRIQVDAARASGRDAQRKDIQAFVNTHIFGPLIEDGANHSALLAQLDGAGDAIVPTELATAVLDYTGAQLSQAEDGKWGFNLGPISYKPDALEPMTYSQARNKLNLAHQGRVQSLSGVATQIGELAQLRGFGLNGPSVDDLLFPMAGDVFKQEEAQQAAATPAEPVVAPADVPNDERAARVEESARKFSEAATAVFGGLGRGLMPNFVNAATNVLEFIAPPKGEPSELTTSPSPQTPQVQASGRSVERGRAAYQTGGTLNDVRPRRTIND